MKKSLLILAAAAMVACSTEDVVRLQDPGMISFEASWVENATRADVAADPSTTTESLTGFDVWGFMDAPEAKVFEGEDVTGSKGNFNYLNTQYWIPGHTYYFAALAPMNSDNWDLNTDNANTYGAGVLSFENVDGTEDLLYAATAVESPALGEDKTVMLTFSHLLSKVKFSFTNGFDNEFMTFDVKNIRIVDAPKSGNIDLAVENWWDNNDWVLGADEVELNFGDACEQLAIGAKQQSAYERLTIPAAARSYEIQFDLTLYANGVQVYPMPEDGKFVTKTVIAENIAFEMGKAYHFKSELNAKNFSPDGTEFAPIVFDLEEVKDWVYADEPDAQIEETEFRAAVALGGKVTLTKNIELTKSLIVPEGVSTVIDLNGFNIINNTTDETLAIGDGIVVYGDLTIEGEGTVQGLTRALWARGTTGATVTINGGHFIGANGVTTEVIYASGDGKIVINGGTFEAVTEDNVSFAAPQYAVLNLHNNGAAGCDIVVYGGSFKNFDPANNISENPKHNFCAPGYSSTKVGDYYVVAEGQVVADAEALAEVLTSDAQDIKVTLADNIDLPISSLGQQTGGSGEYKLGGANTENITIDLNGKTLNITTTYWSAIGAKNDNALFTIKNGTMTSTGNSAGTWNAWDLRFSNCNYVFENVVFEKAVALDNVAKSTVMTGVTITDTHNSDTYGLWITAEGQTVTLEDCVIDMTPATDGRGIKIDEQYVDAPALVTLNVANTTFKTDEKAAILVKSKAGAVINAENLDIAGVAADTTNAVWVDSDSAAYYDLVTVNGAKKIQE
ncbi:MAG: fimbrillin family protein [Alistipes sp.]|nr:fimbrillin family protein [Alistipes sp.]